MPANPQRRGRTTAGWDHDCSPSDSVDALVTSWRAQRPDLDFTPVEVISRLDRARSHVDRELDEVFAAFGLTAANFAVLVTLMRIADEHGVSQRRLMDELGLTSGTISVRMDRLIDEGLVERRPDPESKRTTRITITPKGRELFERIAPAHLGNEQRLLVSLEPDEREMLAGLLRKLLVEFEGSVPPPDAPLRLGLVLAPAHVTMALRASVGLEPIAGLLVRTVERGGPAGDAISSGDVLVSAGGRALRSVAALYAAIDAAPGGRLELTVARGAEQHTVTVKLGRAHGIDGALAATAGRTARGEHAV